MGAVLSVQTGSPGALMPGRGLYIHIPFCHAKCAYCDFATYVGQSHLTDRYLSALICEINRTPVFKFDTLFIGGGTPTVLSPDQIFRLFDALRERFDLSALAEATVEANPESATESVLNAYREAGINRVSFGLQSTHNELLKSLSRLHTFEQFLSAYQRARRAGYGNINIDLMFGLPGQTPMQWEETLQTVVKLQPEHVSAYALKVEKGTALSHDGCEVDEDVEAEMYLSASGILKAAGYEHYEISNFAKPGRASAHNLLYWNGGRYTGVGLSSAGFDGRVRRKNARGLLDYITAMEAGAQTVDETMELNESEAEREELMLRLRLQEGVDEQAVARLQLPVFEQFKQHGYATVEGGRYRLTPKGWLVSNQLFQHLV